MEKTAAKMLMNAKTTTVVVINRLPVQILLEPGHAVNVLKASLVMVKMAVFHLPLQLTMFSLFPLLYLIQQAHQ
jgi:hypothetical protein